MKLNPEIPNPLQLPPTGVPFRRTKVSLIQIRPGNAPVVTTGNGLTVITKLVGVPTQVVPPFVKLGVTVIVAVTGADVVFSAVKEIFPEPLAGKPMAGLELVQLNTVPVVAPEKAAAAVVL